MASAIDPAVPADNVKVAKSDIRDNFQAAKNEIEALQEQTSLPRLMANDTRLFKEI